MRPKHKLAFLSAALATLISGLAAVTIVGREARAVELIALFAGGFGAGASVTAALVALRSARVGTSATADVAASPPSGKA